MVEQYLLDHNLSIFVVFERFADMGIDTLGVVALLGISNAPSSFTPIYIQLFIHRIHM